MKKLLVFCLSFLLLSVINVKADELYNINYVLAGGTNVSSNPAIKLWFYS